MNVTRKISREELLDILDSDDVVRNKIIDESRWTNNHEMIFKYDGSLYMTWYSVGKTEYQDESPWEFDGEEIECTKVEQYEKVIIDYRPIVKEQA